jgi:hypothetical protein
LTSRKAAEQRAVYRAFQTMGLQRRHSARGSGGWFVYRASPLNLSFEWDGAGTTSDGSIVLVEAELSPPNVMHIQAHIARLAVMVALKAPVSRFVWVVKRIYYRQLRAIVQTFAKCLQEELAARFPPMEFRDPWGQSIGAPC